jgi:excisionase family DNA binding protein
MESYLDTKGLEEFTSIKAATIRKFVQLDKIPYTKVGRLVRFRTSQIEAWLLERERNTVYQTKRIVQEQVTIPIELFVPVISSEV